MNSNFTCIYDELLAEIRKSLYSDDNVTTIKQTAVYCWRSTHIHTELIFSFLPSAQPPALFAGFCGSSGHLLCSVSSLHAGPSEGAQQVRIQCCWQLNLCNLYDRGRLDQHSTFIAQSLKSKGNETLQRINEVSKWQCLI